MRNLFERFGQVTHGADDVTRRNNDRCAGGNFSFVSEIVDAVLVLFCEYGWEARAKHPAVERTQVFFSNEGQSRNLTGTRRSVVFVLSLV